MELDTRLPLAVKPPAFDLGSVLQQAGAIKGNELANAGTELLNVNRGITNQESALRLKETQSTLR